METVQFKKNSGAAAETFSAVSVTPELVTEEERWIDLAGERRRTVFQTYRRWSIELALLTTAQMDYLLELQAEPAPQMVYDSTTYDVEIEEVKAKYRGGSITVINRDPE